MLNKWKMKVGSMGLQLYPSQLLSLAISSFLRLSPMQALLPSSSICAASRRVSCNRMAMLVLPRRGDFSTRPVFSLLCKAFDCLKKKQACLKKPSAFGDFLKIQSPQRSSIIKLEKMGKEPFWRKLPFLRMTKYGRESWCKKSCDTIDIAYVLDICHRSPFILVWSLGPPKSTYLTHPSILLANTCLSFCNLQKPRLQSSPVISRPHPHRCSPCLHLFSSSIPNDCKTLATFFSFQQNNMNNSYNSIKISTFTQFVTKTWDCHKDSCASGSHFALSEFSECRASQSFHPRCRPCHLKLEASLFCHHEDWSHIFASTFQLQNHKHSNIPKTQNFQLPTRFPISTSMEPRSHNYSRCLAVHEIFWNKKPGLFFGA